jgi:peptidoglycan/LPS O-acetylase OafA/YrhL
VLAFHVWLYREDRPQGERTELLDQVLFRANVGLIAFFVLSGFLLYRGFARAALTGSAPPPTLAYGLRRAARIAPAYYVCGAGCVLLYLAVGPDTILPSAGELPLFAVFGQNYSADTLMQLNPVLWTLTIEVAFYVTLPLLALVGLRLGPRRAGLHALFLLALVAATVAWYWLDYANGWGDIPRKTLPAYIGHFAIGMLVALWLERRRVGDRADLGAARTFALMAAGAIAVVLVGVWQEHVPASALPRQLFATLASAAGFALIVAAAAAGRGPATAWLRSQAIVAVGLVSYGVYLWHLPLLLALRHAGLLPAELAPRILVVLAAALIAAAASWHFVERPCIDWAKRRQRGKASASRAHARPAAAEAAARA